MPQENLLIPKLEARSYKLKTQSVKTRTEFANGKTWLVAPVVMLVEGVVNGEKITVDVMRRSVSAWNGRPVTLNHPKEGAFPISANTPSVLDQMQIGTIFNVTVEGEKMKGEIWFDIVRMQQIGGKAAQLLAAVQQDERIEVSTAYFAKVAAGQGTFKGEDFDGIQTDIIPDHFAVLTDEEGACNWEDGCGIRAASKQQPEKKERREMEPERNVLKQLAEYLRKTFGKNWTEVYEEQILKKINCSHCGEEHELEFRTVEGPFKINTHYALCPETQKPLLIAANADETIKVNGEKLSAILKKMVNERVGEGKTQEDIVKALGDAAGIPVSKVNDIMKGKIDFPQRRWLQAFASHLDVDPIDLFMAADADTRKFRGQKSKQQKKGEQGLERKDVLGALQKIPGFPLTDEVVEHLLTLEDGEFNTELSKLKVKPQESSEDDTRTEAEKILLAKAEEEKKVKAQAEKDEKLRVQKAKEEEEAKALAKLSDEEREAKLKAQAEEDAKPKDLKDWLASCPDQDFRESQIRENEKHKAHRKTLVESLVKNGMTECEVKGLSTETLEKFVGKVEPKADFSGRSPVYNEEDPDAIPEAPAVLLAPVTNEERDKTARANL